MNQRPERQSPGPDPLKELTRACGPRQRIDRLHARAVLLAIGERVLAEDASGAEELAKRVLQITTPRTVADGKRS